MRLLVVVPPLVGHLNPAASVAAELLRRGHDVRVAGHAPYLGEWLPDGLPLVPLDPAPARRCLEAMDDVVSRLGTRALAAAFWPSFVEPLARAMRPEVARIVGDLRPDAMLVDYHALGGALAAGAAGVPWATSAVTPDVLLPDAIGPEARDVIRRKVAPLAREAGLPPGEHHDLSPGLVIAYSTARFFGMREDDPRVRWVGPSLLHRPRVGAAPDVASLPPRPRVLVTFGTALAAAAPGVLGTVVAGVRAAGASAVVVGALPAPPGDGTVAIERAPLPELLPEVDGVVCHGGVNTVSEALVHGVPLLVTPLAYDQFRVAELVMRSGAGLRLRRPVLREGDVAAGLRRVLGEPAFAAAARAVGAELAAAGGTARAADEVEAWAGGAR